VSPFVGPKLPGVSSFIGPLCPMIASVDLWVPCQHVKIHFVINETRPDPSELSDGNYANPNDGAGYYAAVAHSHVYEMSCAAGPGGASLYYVTESGPDPVNSRCDIREVVGEYTTTVTAGPATATAAGIRGLNARIAREDGWPVWGARIVFTAADGTHLGTVFSRTDGAATCDSDVVVSQGVLLKGYTATFAGSGDDGIWKPASATGAITLT
jgi:hypothetical protein